MWKIPQEWQNIPEAKRLAEAREKFTIAIQEERRLILSNNFDSVRQLHVKELQRELQEAEAAFDWATGEPKPPGLTPTVIERIKDDFPLEQQTRVIDLIDKECGRNLAFERESSAQELEFIRLCVLELSKGDMVKLRQEIELAKKDQRDVIAAVQEQRTKIPEFFTNSLINTG